jgi:DNA-binding GntR family transcriptional regulator
LTEITGQPAYQQVASDLRRKIVDGAYPVGEPIPATNQLMGMYHGSITVVRAAIKELQSEGILIGQPGKGVYVQRLPTDDELQRNSDTYARLTELEGSVRELSSRLAEDVATDLADLRRQLGVVQSQVMELYGRMGMHYSHDPAQQPAGGKRSKSA